MASHCIGWLQISKTQADNIIAALPTLCQLGLKTGELQEADHDKHSIPNDSSGLRRGELNSMSRQRAQCMNHENMIRRRDRKMIEQARTEEAEAAQHAADEAARAAASRAAAAKKAKTKADRVQKCIQEEKDREERAKLRRVRAAVKKAKEDKNNERIAIRNRLLAANAYCYCETVEESGTFLVCGGGARRCPYRGYVHHTCATTRGDVVPPGEETFWCDFCVHDKPT